MKVLVADDELPIREWLRLSIQNLGEDLEVLTAGNGKEAWEIYEKEAPGLVVTDIKMPRMDGLELLRKIKEENPEVYVVMLTSYGEFEYAREAIKHQANEYVLKNEITSEVLSAILEKFLQSRERGGTKAPKRYIAEVLGTENEKFYFSEKAKNEQIFAVAFADSAQGEEAFESYLNSFVERIEQFFYEPGISIWLCHCRQLSSMGVSFQEAMSFCRNLSGLKEESVGFSGFSDSCREACIQARKALNFRFYENRRGIYTYQEDDGEAVRRIQAIRRQTLAYLGQGRREDAAISIQDLFAEIGRDRLTDLELIDTSIQDLVDAFKVANIEFADHALEEICKETKRQLHQAESFLEMREILYRFLTKLDETLQVQEKPYSKYVKSALSYVADNYAAIESLAEVSGYVNLNTEYFCRIFKAEVGETFNSYLTEYRVKKAVELLTKTDLKVYEVAERVGYSNLSYFSRVFKKVTGENPFSYKN